jgi:hypothetical protein
MAVAAVAVQLFDTKIIISRRVDEINKIIQYFPTAIVNEQIMMDQKRHTKRIGGQHDGANGHHVFKYIYRNLMIGVGPICSQSPW